ncbi:hypothetical protein U8C31_18260 [Sinorhizobium medicae]|uniref:hypothetical protein n=1 Tax=Sinorhizobium medicae TaxID=110321 RepID=UPI002AF6C337|nr:hypothetical protein [Sinorhizobium medicae]WQO72181.1 hypothetical protein U8C31_18260 [Sinorhizobium medicae]
MFRRISEWLNKNKINQVVMSDMTAASKLVTMIKSSWQAPDGSVVAQRNVDGLLVATTVIGEAIGLDHYDCLTGKGLDRTRAANISDAALRFAQDSAGIDDLSENTGVEGKSIKLGYLLFYHNFRLGFVETQLHDERVRAVQLTRKMIQSFMSRQLDVAFEKSTIVELIAPPNATV